MRKSPWKIWLLTAFLVLTGVLLICTCTRSKGSSGQPFYNQGDGADDQCPISDKNVQDQVYVADCFDPFNQGNVITVDRVRGTAAHVVNGERFVITGSFQLTQISKGKIEPIVNCPAGSDYGKCSYPFDKKSGKFEVRVAVADCDVLDKPDQITLNLWDNASNAGAPVCVIYFGNEIPDDDAVDDDAVDDDTVDA